MPGSVLRDIERPRLPKQRAYVVKTSRLEAVSARAGLEAVAQLRYWTPQVDGSVLEAEYWLPNERVPHPRVSIRAGSLPKELQRDAFVMLEEIALPAFAGEIIAVGAGIAIPTMLAMGALGDAGASGEVPVCRTSVSESQLNGEPRAEGTQSTLCVLRGGWPISGYHSDAAASCGRRIRDVRTFNGLRFECDTIAV